MFSFFKSSVEKDLIKLGFNQLIKGYKQKVRSKEWTKQQYTDALKSVHKKHLSELQNIGNVNVATRQSFDDDELLTPLNLQNIQQEYIDIDYLYSSILFDYNTNKRIHAKALSQLEQVLKERFPDAVVSDAVYEKLKDADVKLLIDEAMRAMDASNKDYLQTVFTLLKNRL